MQEEDLPPFLPLDKAHSHSYNYAFIKPRAHFAKQELNVRVHDDQAHHSAKKMKKKSSGDSRQRTESTWLKLTNQDQVQRKRLFPLIVTAGEIYRFEIGNVEPKYRILNQEGRYNIITKEITAGVAFHDYFQKNIDQDLIRKRNAAGWYKIDSNNQYALTYVGNHFLEGMGRITTCNYLYGEDDAHFYNAYVNQDNYFVAIDRDRSFWPITYAFHSSSFGAEGEKLQQKFIYYQSTYPNVSLINAEEERYSLSELEINNMGILCVKDYDNLPILENYFPATWGFMQRQFKPYAKKLAKNALFLNEKHFSTLKYLVTFSFKQLLINLHVSDINDATNMHQFMQERFHKLIEICKQSNAFLTYLNANRPSLMQIIFYEINTFFKDNAHYVPTENQDQHIMWHYSIYQIMMAEFSSLLTAWECLPQTEIEENILKQYTMDIRDNKAEAIQFAIDFYEQQGMKYHAKLGQQRLQLLQYFETFFHSKSVLISQKHWLDLFNFHLKMGTSTDKLLSILQPWSKLLSQKNQYPFINAYEIFIMARNEDAKFNFIKGVPPNYLLDTEILLYNRLLNSNLSSEKLIQFLACWIVPSYYRYCHTLAFLHYLELISNNQLTYFIPGEEIIWELSIKATNENGNKLFDTLFSLPSNFNKIFKFIACWMNELSTDADIIQAYKHIKNEIAKNPALKNFRFLTRKIAELRIQELASTHRFREDEKIVKKWLKFSRPNFFSRVCSSSQSSYDVYTMLREKKTLAQNALLEEKQDTVDNINKHLQKFGESGDFQFSYKNRVSM